ncbi:hypothetical protein BDV18DRAFT_146242 [Aspergillus unguis]
MLFDFRNHESPPCGDATCQRLNQLISISSACQMPQRLKYFRKDHSRQRMFGPYTYLIDLYVLTISVLVWLLLWMLDTVLPSSRFPTAISRVG